MSSTFFVRPPVVTAVAPRIRLGFPSALREHRSSIIGKVVAFTAAIGALVCLSQTAAAQLAQQGPKLVGTAAVGAAQQGFSVAVSADGNTAIVGGNFDTSMAGAAWVFTRSNGVWSQVGQKLVGTGAVGAAQQGFSVALSADGNTAMVGGYTDNGDIGAAWIYTRSNGVWSQQGQKLVGNDALGESLQGQAIALSADGNTAIVGASGDNGNIGAAWVYTRSNGVWFQQGPKLVGTGAVGMSQQSGVALSADGNTAIVGGAGDNGSIGATWVFTRSNAVWTQQGSKLIGSGASGPANQGSSVSLSADGKTAIVGGIGDSGSIGAAWIFFQPPKPEKANTHDFNADGYSDIAWRDTSGNTAIWLMKGATLLSPGGIGTVPTTWSIVGQRDFDGNGTSDLLWRDTGGNTAIWFMNGTQVASSAAVGTIPTSWTVVGTGDFDGDGKGDIVWQDSSGNTAVWLMNGASISASGALGNLPPAWSVAGVGDFDGDGSSDLLWRDTCGNTAIWLMNGTQVSASLGVGNIPTNWTVVGTGDFNGDHKSDLLWRDTNGNMAVWLMNGAQVSSSLGLGQIPADWQVAETGDFNDDQTSDLLWYSSTFGAVAVWFMSGGQIAQSAGIGFMSGGWTIQGTNAD